MTKRVQHKRSSTAAAVPAAGDLVIGELFVNFGDRQIWTKNESNAVMRLSSQFKISTSDLSNPTNGDAYLNSSTGKLKAFYGAVWNILNPDPDLSAAVLKAGDTMTGQLTLVGGGSGAQAISVSEAAALDTTAADLKVSKAGDTMTGQLTLPGGGTGNQAVTKTELDAAVVIATPDLTAYLLKTGGTLTGQLGLPGGGTGSQAATATELGAAMAAHVAAADPHTGYLKETDFNTHKATGATEHPAATTSIAGFMSSADKTALNALVAGSGVPPGAIFDYAGTTEPTGFIFCYGQAISRATFSALFTAIGTTYGAGNGSTTFNVPDLRGRVSAGQDDMGGTSANRLTGVVANGVNGDTLGGVGGAEWHTLSLNETPSHSHLAGIYSVAGTLGPRAQPGAVLDSTYSTQAAGGGASHNNIQPTIILNKIIKT